MDINKFKLAGECYDKNSMYLGRYIYLWHPSQQEELDNFCRCWLKTYETDSRFFLARDYETSGLIPNLGKIFLVSVAWDSDHAVVFFPENFDLTLWKEVLNTIPTVNQNQKFDLGWEIQHWGVKPINKLCTLHAAKVAYTGYLQKYSLDVLTRVFGDGIELEKESRKEFPDMEMVEEDGIYYAKGIKSSNPSLQDYHVEYAARDTIVVFRIIRKIIHRLIDLDLWDFYQQIEHPLDMLFAEEELQGIAVDWEFVQKTWNEAKLQLLEYETNLYQSISEFTEEEKVKLKFNRTEKVVKNNKEVNQKRKEFNPGSADQVVNVLNYWGLKVKSTAEEDLEILKSELIEDDTEKGKKCFNFLVNLINYRKQKNYVSKYLKSWIEDYSNPVTNKIHPSFQSIASNAQTGRMSASAPNVMAVQGSFRQAITASKPSRVLLCKDYSGYEFRAAAGLSNEPVLLQAFLKRAEYLPLMKELTLKYGQTDPDDFVKDVVEKKKVQVSSSDLDLCMEFMGVDIHRQNGALIFNKPAYEITGELRSVSKTIGYLSLYAGSANRLRISLSKENIYYKIARCEEILKLFFSKLNALAEYQERLKRAVFDPGWIQTPLGRKKFALLPNYKPRNYAELVASTEREFINFAQQGANVDALKLSMIELNEYFKENYEPEIRPRCLIPVHDELVVECEKFLVNEVDPIMEAIMVKNGSLSINNTCPIECSSKMDYVWLK